MRSSTPGAVALVAAMLLLLPALIFAPAGTATHATSPVPHVIVGIPDSGINPYHQMYYRPALTEHPCTYIPGFPCDIPALELTLGGTNYAAAVNADAAKWEAIRPGDWFWIPRTVFVAVHCEREYDTKSPCILDGHGHGTGTTSSALMENPDALIAFKEGGSSIAPFLQKGIPVDIYSVSWGNVVPVPGHPSLICLNWQTTPIFVTGAGNDPRSTLIDCRKGEPSLISVGGAYAASDSEEAFAAKQPEVVSYYCRPTADHLSTSSMRTSYCGTSFSGPTVAGALSKVVLALRQSSGYTGGLSGDVVDPLLGVTTGDVRDALNRTASYTPATRYSNDRFTAIPLSQDAPWIQWGWGFYDGLVADATIAHLTGAAVAPAKPALARDYMAAQHEAKHALYGPL